MVRHLQRLISEQRKRKWKQAKHKRASERGKVFFPIHKVWEKQKPRPASFESRFRPRHSSGCEDG